MGGHGNSSFFNKGTVPYRCLPAEGSVLKHVIVKSKSDLRDRDWYCMLVAAGLCSCHFSAFRIYFGTVVNYALAPTSCCHQART